MRASTAVFRSASRRGVILAIGVAMVTAAAAAAGNDTAALSGKRKDDPSFTYLVPAVVQTPGLEGTQWRTALSLVNQSGDRAYYRMYYHLPSGSHEATGALDNWSTSYYPDVVSRFGLTPGGRYSGTLEIVSDRPIVVCARIYNQTDDGTFGQYMPAIAPGVGLPYGEVGILSMLRRNLDFRTNVGFLNPSEGTCIATVSVYTYDSGGSPLGSPFAVELAPHRWAQVNDVFEAVGAGGGGYGPAFATVVLDAEGCELWSYASVIDNRTGDATTIPALPLETLPPP